MDFLKLAFILFLFSAYAGSNAAKGGADKEAFYTAMETADNNLTAASLSLMANYTNTSKPTMERGVALFSGTAVGMFSLIGLEAAKYGFNNPGLDYQLYAWIIIFLMLLPYMEIIMRPVMRLTGRIIYGL